MDVASRIVEELKAGRYIYSGAALGTIQKYTVPLEAVRRAAALVVRQTTAEAAYRLHDGLIEALEMAEQK